MLNTQKINKDTKSLQVVIQNYLESMNGRCGELIDYNY